MKSDQAPTEVLDQECIAFTSYLLKQKPNDYVMGKYREAHRTSEVMRNLRPGPFDSVLLNLGRVNGILTKLVDTYTCLFFRHSAIRKKMVLLLAILESCAPTYDIFDTTEPGGRQAFLARLAGQGLVFGLCLIFAALLLMPLQFTLAVGFKLSSVPSMAARAFRHVAKDMARLGAGPRDQPGAPNEPGLPPG